MWHSKIGLKESIGPSPSNFKDIKSHINHNGYAFDAFWLWEKTITRWISYWLWTLIWGHKHVKVGQLDDPCWKNKSWWKIKFENLNFRTFTNVINFGVY
jgi:hypothetical protein